jgi:two-component system sensor histidine kinase ChvG
MKFDKPARKGASIAWLLLVFNALLVFLPVAAFLSLDSYEKSLLDSLEHALAQQGRFLAAWLSGQALTREEARHAVAALRHAHTARIRVIDSSGRLIADSSTDPGSEPDSDQGAVGSGAGSAANAQAGAKDEINAEEIVPQDSLLYEIYSLPVRFARRFLLPPQPNLESADFYASISDFRQGHEVRSALKGNYGSSTRISSGGQVSVTLYSALPIPGPVTGQPQGAVLVSQSTYRILAALYGLRVQVGKIFLFSMIAALGLTILLWLFVLRPVRRLSRRAARALRPENAAEEPFPPSARRDEIGELSRSLSEFSQRLKQRLSWAERFSQDAAHELKNPIASIRAAAELLEGSPDPDGRKAAAAIGQEAARMDRIVNGLRRLSRMDSDKGQVVRVEAVALARNAALRHSRLSGREIPLEASEAAERARVLIDPDRLVIALDTLLENALSFTPAGEPVRLEARTESGNLRLSVIDQGPGIAPENLERIFDRFFTYRPDDGNSERHAGLGLSIALAVAQGAGGSIEAVNGEGGNGARFSISLPLA